MSQADYDAVVIGAGISGLVAANWLARGGARVLLCERHRVPGGYCSGFVRKGYRFDACVHFINGCGPGGVTRRILDEIGVGDRVAFERPDPMTTLMFPDLTVEIPQDLGEFRRYLKDRYPAEAAAVDRFFGLMVSIYEEANERFFEEGRALAGRSPGPSQLYRHRSLTFGQLLDEYFQSPHLKQVLGGQLCYSGLPGSQVSAVWLAIQLVTHHLSGSFYPRGGMQAFADELAASVVRNGGRVSFRAEVARILTEGGRVSAVRLAGGETVSTRAVVATGNVRDTFCRLVGEEVAGGRLLRRISRLVPSISAFCVYLGVRLDLERLGINGSNYLVHDNPDYESQARQLAAGELAPDGSLFVSAPTVKDPSLSPGPGRHCVSVITLAPYHVAGGWPAQKQRFAADLCRRAERVIPGLTQAIEVSDAATPLTLERYTGNWDGACYGLATTPDQVFITRPLNRTSIPGLFLAGHYTFPGLGIQAVAQSGVITGRLALEYLEGSRLAAGGAAHAG
ncbi:MAG: NAD(P)/FAD-dependent oxidoreductase [Acetobacteraceae bacterium]|nr:NAD(P)/FAD-dependent oxidoreductase [Acetobacteraceae bacterium]